MNTKSPNLKMNFIYTLLYQVLTLIVPLVTTPYISRIFSSGDIGIISYTTSICNYFLILGNLGIATYAQLEIAKHRDNKHNVSKLFFEISTARTTTMLISMMLYIGFIYINGRNILMYWMLITNIIGSVFDFSWFYQGLENFKKVTIRNAVVKIISLILIFVLIKERADLYLYVVIMYGSIIVANVYLLVGIRKNLEKVEIKELEIFRHLKGCIIYFVPSIASILNVSVGKTLLGYIGENDPENGYFEQAYKIYNIIIMLPASLNLIMRPRMAYLIEKDQREEINQKMLYSLRFIIFTMVLISFGIVGTAERFVPWFFGTGWDNVIVLLQIFGFCILFKSISLCFSEQYYLPFNKVNTLTVILYIGLVINILLNIILVPKYLSVGSSIAATVTELIILILALFFSRKNIKVFDIIKISVKYLVSGAGMLALLYFMNIYIPNSIIGFFIMIFAGVVFYILVLIILHDKFVFDSLKKAKNIIVKIKNRNSN